MRDFTIRRMDRPGGFHLPAKKTIIPHPCATTGLELP